MRGMHVRFRSGKRLTTARVAMAAVAVAAALASASLGLGGPNSRAGAQTAGTGNGAKRFADLQELNNKLARAIKRVEGEQTHKNSIVKDTGRERRTVNDLETTKLRAVDQFPRVFGLSFASTFKPLSCIDEDIAIGKTLLDELHGGFLRPGSPGTNGERYASRLLLNIMKDARNCKDRLEVETEW